MGATWWSQSENDLLVSLVKTGIDWDEIKIQFPNRTKQALKDRARDVGLRWKGSYWSPEEDALLINLVPTAPSWSKLLFCFPRRTRNSIYHRMSVLGLKKINWTEADLAALEGSEYSQMYASIHNHSRETIKYKRRSLGYSALPHRVPFRNKCDGSVFQNITPLASYWAAFIFADGHIRPKGTALSISLSFKDEEHLQKLADFLKFQGRIVRFEASSFSGKSKAIRLSVCEQELVSGLSMNYFVPIGGKKLSYKAPTHLDESNTLAFLAGLIDADGCIVKRKHYGTNGIPTERESFLVHLCGHRHILEWILSFLHERELVSCRTKVTKHSNSEKISVLYLQGTKFMKVAERIQTLGLPLMSRKWDKVMSDLACKLVA